MTYQTELLVEQRVAELQHAGASIRVTPTETSPRWRLAARTTVSRTLVRVAGWVSPVGTPATR